MRFLQSSSSESDDAGGVAPSDSGESVPRAARASASDARRAASTCARSLRSSDARASSFSFFSPTAVAALASAEFSIVGASPPRRRACTGASTGSGGLLLGGANCAVGWRATAAEAWSRASILERWKYRAWRVRQLLAAADLLNAAAQATRRGELPTAPALAQPAAGVEPVAYWPRRVGDQRRAPVPGAPARDCAARRTLQAAGGGLCGVWKRLGRSAQRGGGGAVVLQRAVLAHVGRPFEPVLVLAGVEWARLVPTTKMDRGGAGGAPPAGTA